MVGCGTAVFEELVVSDKHSEASPGTGIADSSSLLSMLICTSYVVELEALGRCRWCFSFRVTTGSAFDSDRTFCALSLSVTSSMFGRNYFMSMSFLLYGSTRTRTARLISVALAAMDVK